MADCRDWLQTLWRASFKGFPFYIEKDEESGGRRVVVHEFPMRDDPYLEDLGQAPRYYEASAYVASDAADVEAIAFLEVLASNGPGLLVLPATGPRLSRCTSFQRDFAKDKLGYLGFRLKFVREGAAFAAPAAPMLANAVIMAANTLATVASAAFALAAVAKNMPDYVVSAGVDMIESVGGAIDEIRTTNTVLPDVSADVRDAVAELVGMAPTLFNRLNGASSEYPARVFEAVRDLGDAMRAGEAISAFGVNFDAYAPAAIPTPATAFQMAAAQNANEAARSYRLAVLSAYAEATIRFDYRSRQEGISARANLAERFDEELSRAEGYGMAPLYVALQELRNAAVDYLSQAITDLAPVVTVSSNISLPSLYWAHRLYQDPGRADELIQRNNVQHPSFFPMSFEALAR